MLRRPLCPEEKDRLKALAPKQLTRYAPDASNSSSTNCID